MSFTANISISHCHAVNKLASQRQNRSARSVVRCNSFSRSASVARRATLLPTGRRSVILAADTSKSATELTDGAEEEKPDSRAGLEEKFAVIDTGLYECKSCQFVYDEKIGDSSYPVSAGTRFRDLPEDWRCPVCSSDKNQFMSKSKVVAGFEQNQGYGLGGNTLTSGEKQTLIYGALFLFFALFISGYLLD